MHKSPILGAAFGVFAVWWLVSLAAYLVTGKVWTGGVWFESSARAWTALAGGSLLGSAATGAYVFVARQWKLASMAGDDVRGVRCSIGQLPMHLVRPSLAVDFPEKSRMVFPLKEHDKQGKINPDWMDEWFKKYERDFPEHATVMRAAARVLNENPNLPAAALKSYKGEPLQKWGDDRNQHGDMTLLAHSWISGSVGVWRSLNGFSYTGIQDAIVKDQNIDLVDPKYKFATYDPLIGLICFIHDIGKIETFKQTKKKGSNEVTFVQTRPRSDTAGAALMARMDEFWALPYEDRMIITLTVGNYRKPTNMPLRRDINNPNKAAALSDRTMAMLKLITQVDDEVGLIEEGKEPAPGVQAVATDRKERELAKLWDCFKDLMNESFRIHHENHKFRVGQKNMLADGPVITLKEDVLRAALVEKLTSKRKGGDDGAAADEIPENLTETLLSVLDTNGCLIKEVAGIKMDAAGAVWKIEFHGKDKQKPGESIATWPYAIMINPKKHFPRLCQDQDASSTPQVIGPAKLDRMLEVRAPRAPGPVDALLQGALEDERGVPMIAEGTKGKKQQQAPRGPAPPPAPAPVATAAAKQQVRAARSNSQQRDARGEKELFVPTKPVRQNPRVVHQTGDVDSVSDQDQGAPSTIDSNVVSLASRRGPTAENAEKAEAVHTRQPESSTEEVAEPQAKVTSIHADTSSSFLDEVDPPAPPLCADKHQSDLEEEAAEVDVAEEKGHVDQVPNGQVPTKQTAVERSEEPLAESALDTVRKKLRDNALASPPSSAPVRPQHHQAQAVAKQPGADIVTLEDTTDYSPLPDDVVEIARTLYKKLEWLDYLTQQKKIAPDTMEDGRLAYSLDAIKAHDVRISEWLDAEMLSKLMMAKRSGPNVPVCFMRTTLGVSLLVINTKSVRQVMR